MENMILELIKFALTYIIDVLKHAFNIDAVGDLVRTMILNCAKKQLAKLINEKKNHSDASQSDTSDENSNE